MNVVEASVGKVTIEAVPQLGWRTKVLYGVGGVAGAMKSVIFGLFTFFFYTTVMGLPATLVGIASAIGVFWDAIIDPYIGYLSDNARFRLGRRHPFMVIGALLLGVSFWALFSPPRSLPTTGLFIWLLVTNVLVRTSHSLFGVPYSALGAELSEDYHERTAIMGIRGLLGLLGTLAAAALSFVVFFPDTVPGVDPKLNYAGYPTMGLTFGLVMTTVGLIATFGTLSWRSRAGHHPALAAHRPSFFSSFAQSLRNPSFRVLFFSVSLFFLGVVINSMLSIHYLTYYVKITASTSLSTFQLAFYVGALVGVAFWLGIARVVQKHWLYILATLVTASLMVAALLLVGEGHLFGTGNVPVMVIGHALGGFFGSVLWFMPASMIADVADEDELVSGQRREGAFFGIFSFGEQLAGGLALLLTGVLADRFAGLIPGQVHQSATTIQRVALLYSVLPAVLLVLAALLLVRYSLSRTRVQAVQAELARRRGRGRNGG